MQSVSIKIKGAREKEINENDFLEWEKEKKKKINIFKIERFREFVPVLAVCLKEPIDADMRS